MDVFIPRELAVNLIRSSRPGYSIGRAEATFRAAVLSGEVRYHRTDYKSYRRLIQGRAGDKRQYRFEQVSLDNLKLPPPEDSPVDVSRDDLRDWLDRHAPQEQPPASSAQAATSHAQPTTPKSGAGHPEDYDWDEAEQFAMRELESCGDPRKVENRVPGWRSQEDLVRAVVLHLETLSKDGTGPDPATVRKRAPAWLDKFEKHKAK